MIQAKMRCQSVTHPYPGVQYVHLFAVYSQDPNDPNYSYSQATPSAELRMTITNPEAFGAFKAGHEYIIPFEEVPAETK